MCEIVIARNTSKAGQQVMLIEEKVIKAAGDIHGRPVRVVFHDDQSSPLYQPERRLVRLGRAIGPALHHPTGPALANPGHP